MTGASLEDRKARERVRGGDDGVGAFDRDTNLVVMAGAGSGKTRALVDRMVALVRSGVPIDRMAAITFTVRAAGEMRVRFFETLRTVTETLERDAADGADPDRAAELARLREASGRVEDLFIDTIHTFCRSMLAERPVEAGIPPEFRVVDDREELEMRGRFWHAYLAEALRAGPRTEHDWEDLGVDLTTLSEFFGRRCTHEDLDLVPGRTDPPDLGAAVEAVETWLDTVLGSTPPADTDRDRLVDSLRRMDRYRRIGGLRTPGRQAAFLESVDGLVRDDGSIADLRVGLWKAHGEDSEAMLESIRGKAEEPVVEALPPFVLERVRPVLTAWREYLYGEVGAFVDGAVRAYADHRASEGRLTFQDLLLRAARLLRTNPGARRHFRRRYRCLLVDEFQDTDPVQAEVAFLLAADDPSVTDWTRTRPAPGSLFLVGDDKQSIYRFRRADVQVFRQARERIERTAGESLRFTSNFRSRPALCDWINGAMRASFDDAPPYQAEWEDLRPVRPEGGSGPPALALDLEKRYRNLPKEIARQEAPIIAGAIERLLAGEPIPTRGGGPVAPAGGSAGYDDVMILLRAATHAAEYTRELERRGIPYVASGGKALGKEPVVRAVLDLLEAALDPDHPVHLLAVLRGPFVGVSDEELRRFRAGGGVFRHDAESQVPMGSFAAVGDGFRLIERTRHHFTTLPVGEAMANLLDERGLLAGVGVRAEGPSSAGALLRLLTVARRVDGHGAGWIALMDELRRLDSGAVDMESQTIETGGPAVRVMTVHQAKGLEARVVFLAYPVEGRTRPVDFHVDRSGEGARIFLPCRDGHRTIAAPPGWAEAEAEARRFEAAEENRLVYVAATRARDLLVVSRYPEKLAGPWAPLYPYLADAPVIDAAGPEWAMGPRTGNMLAHSDLLTRHDETNERLREARTPTHERESVTGSPDREDPFEVEARGFGRGFGRAVHRLLQLVVERRSDPPSKGTLSAVASRVVDDETGSASDERRMLTDRAVGIAEAFVRGPVWAELVSADRVFCEAPVVTGTASGDRVVSGVVDLVYRTPAGWTVVDYKTEDAGAEALRDRYAAQLAAYRAHWEAATGETVARTLIWPATPEAAHAIECG